MLQSMHRRGALALLASACVVRSGAAAPSINHMAKIVVGAVPGGGTDLVARLLAEQLRGRYAPQVVENRPGANARLGAEAVKAAVPDGATILQSPMPVLTLFPHVFPKTTRYDSLTDFVPVATLGIIGYGWVVRARHPAQTLPEFLDWARARGGATFAPPVIGAPQHLIALTVASRAGVTLTPVPYRGGAQSQQDLLAGRIDSVISHMGDLTGLLRGGQTRLLAVTTHARLPGWPEVPTFAEAGFGGLPEDEAFVVVLPARTPPATVAALHQGIEAAVANPVMREGLERIEMAPLVLSQEATAERLRTEYARWGEIVRATGFVIDD